MILIRNYEKSYFPLFFKKLVFELAIKSHPELDSGSSSIA